MPKNHLGVRKHEPQDLPMCVILPFSFFVKHELICKLMRNLKF